MTLNLLDVVILQRDLPERGLAAGDLGTIVELYGDTAAEVEFVRASGRTQALVELAVSDLREVRDQNLLTGHSLANPGTAAYRSRAVHCHHRPHAAAVQQRHRHTGAPHRAPRDAQYRLHAWHERRPGAVRAEVGLSRTRRTFAAPLSLRTPNARSTSRRI